MHMADALLSPIVGGAFWIATGATIAVASRRLRDDPREHLTPLMGVFGAFVFAAQMVNFTIPGTGSSGHLGGGLLLAALVGPSAALIVMASVLTVQALFFADGGLLALGANIFNLGILPCLIAYPLIYRPLMARAGDSPSPRRVGVIATLAAVAGLQMGALAVVLQTTASGVSNLPFSTFLALMAPIHLAIGVAEGLATAALLVFLRQARPDVFAAQEPPVRPMGAGFPVGLVAGLGFLALFTGAVLSWFASRDPDGLEWAIAKTAGHAKPEAAPSPLRDRLADLQQFLAPLPDYNFIGWSAAAERPWPAIEPGASLSALVGGVASLLLAAAVARALRGARAERPRRSRNGRA